MTNDQKNAIKDAAKAAFDSNYTCTHDNIEAIAAAIEKYDELANKEFDSFVKNFIHLISPSNEIKPLESTPNNENIAFFIPAGENNQNNIRVFDSAADMFAILSADFKSHIAISDSHVDKSDSDWPNPKYLYKIYMDKNKMFHIGDFIGICDYQSFKKG